MRPLSNGEHGFAVRHRLDALVCSKDFSPTVVETPASKLKSSCIGLKNSLVLCKRTLARRQGIHYPGGLEFHQSALGWGRISAPVFLDSQEALPLDLGSQALPRNQLFFRPKSKI